MPSQEAHAAAPVEEGRAAARAHRDARAGATPAQDGDGSRPQGHDAAPVRAGPPGTLAGREAEVPEGVAPFGPIRDRPRPQLRELVAQVPSVRRRSPAHPRAFADWRAVTSSGSATRRRSRSTRKAGAKLSAREPIPDQDTAVRRVTAWLATIDRARTRRIDAVGHRVVHGGERFTEPALIDAEVLAAIEGLETLAPLHNAPSLAGIRAARGGARLRRPDGRRLRYGLPRDDPRARLPLRHPPRAGREARDPALRLPRPRVSLGARRVRPHVRDPGGAGDPRGLPSRERLLRGRDPARALGGHVDGPDARSRAS